MIVQESLNTIPEAPIFQTRDGVGNGDGGQTDATIEAVISQTRDGVGNGDGGQTAATSEADSSQTRNSLILFCSFVTSYDICTLKYDTKTYLCNNNWQYCCKSTPTEVFITN